MAIFDVRKESATPTFDEIVFAEPYAANGSLQAYKLEPRGDRSGKNDVRLYDGDDYVYVNSAEHARNLIKGLEQAIAFGWLK